MYIFIVYTLQQRIEMRNFLKTNVGSFTLLLKRLKQVNS